MLRRLFNRLTWQPTPGFRPPVLWSKGTARYCDVAGPDSYWGAATESCQPVSFFRQHYAGAKGLIWVRLGSLARDGSPCDLDNFVRGALPAIREPFILLTTDGDASVPSDLQSETVAALLDSPNLIAWYTQNHDGQPHPKFAPFPIGLDLHTPRTWSSPACLVDELERIRAQRLPLEQAPRKVFCDLEVSLASEERHRVVAALRECEHVDFLPRRVSQLEIWRRYASYPFAISTEGNGLDCHRTWELLYLGSIVITKTSPLDRLFEGLPVAIVEDWHEVADHCNMERWLRELGPLTDSNHVWQRLDPDRLIGTIRGALPHP